MDIKRMRISLLDCNKNIISTKRLTEIQIKEECILKKSIEWYNDPEPCMIHRSAVMKRIYFELLEYFEMQKKQGTSILPLKAVPDSILSNFDIESEVSFIGILL